MSIGAHKKRPLKRGAPLKKFLICCRGYGAQQTDEACWPATRRKERWRGLAWASGTEIERVGLEASAGVATLPTRAREQVASVFIWPLIQMSISKVRCFQWRSIGFGQANPSENSQRERETRARSLNAVHTKPIHIQCRQVSNGLAPNSELVGRLVACCHRASRAELASSMLVVCARDPIWSRRKQVAAVV